MIEDPANSDEILSSLPDWGEREEEWFVDFFGSISDVLMGSRCGEDCDPPLSSMTPENRYAAIKEDLEMAADLAELAVAEMLDRIDPRRDLRKQKRKKARQTYQKKRKAPRPKPRGR